MIIGLDEAGMGAWAGPVMVGAVATPAVVPFFWPEVNDSKALTPGERERLFGLISAAHVPWAVGMATHQEIDTCGLGQARRRAAQRAMCSLFNKHGDLRQFSVLIDGSSLWGLDDFGDPGNDQRWKGKLEKVVRADQFIKEVSAASICAKHVRDFWMTTVDGTFPEYGFALHKGYGTRVHAAALERYGPCGLHRYSVRPVRERLAREDW